MSRVTVSEEEDRLIRRARGGDPAAFAEIYGRHHPAIYRYILFQVGDRAAAEDLAGEVFVRMVEQIDRFPHRGRPLLAWLYTIASNLVADHRGRNGRPTPVLRDEGLEANPVGQDAAGLTASERRVAAALQELTEAQRQVVVLKLFEGLDNQTVATIVDEPVGAVKSLQHQGLATLRRVFEREDD